MNKEAVDKDFIFFDVVMNVKKKKIKALLNVGYSYDKIVSEKG